VGDLRVEPRGPVTILTLVNPSRRNALDGPMCTALARTIGQLSGDARAIVLTGEGDRAFCAGFDVTALTDQAPALFGLVLEALAASRTPIVCALNGAAHGGGCELAAACDLRVAHANVELAMPPARLGIVYHALGLARFAALVGEARARELFLTARAVGAEEAVRWGLVNEIVADPRARAIEIAEGIADLAPLAVAGMRRTFEALLAARVKLEPREEAELAVARKQAWESADAAEARKAFSEKRKPLFRGR
jgi:enoyl-CoA hydratase/carnithine racemase